MTPEQVIENMNKLPADISKKAVEAYLHGEIGVRFNPKSTITNVADASVESVESISDITDKMIDECHSIATASIDPKSGIDYQDAANVFIFRKIAELTATNRELTKRITALEKQKP